MCNIDICRHLTALFEAENQSTMAVFVRKRACAHFSTLFRPSLFPGFMSSVFDCNLMDVAGKPAIGFRCHDDRMHNLIIYYYDGRCKKTSFIISDYQYLYTYSSLVFEFPILLITPILDMCIVFNILLTI
jgi:hypothetical protein